MRALTRAYQGKGAWSRQKARALLSPDPHTPGSTRTPGFDTPTGSDSAAGDAPPAGVVGHLGFTGASLWWRPAGGRGVVLLTNRVAHGRDNERIKQFRNQVHTLAWQCIKD